MRSKTILSTFVLSLLLLGSLQVAGEDIQPVEIQTSSSGNVLVLHTSSYIADYLTWLSDAGIPAVEYPAYSSIPSVAELAVYDLVMFIPDVLSHNNSQLGDNFADYIELGGKVIVFTFGFHASWGVTGRYNTTHAPFTIGTDPYSSNTYSGGSPHPIMQSVTSLTNSYTEQTNTLTSGAVSLVDWDSGYSMIAQKGNSLGVNLYPGFGYTGDMSVLFQNVALHMLKTSDVLILHKSSYASDYMTWLADAGIVATEYFASNTIPSVDVLSQYRVVMFIPDVLSHNNSQLGDNFADYIELGGKVIVFTFGFHASWGVTGRYNTSYAPFTIGTDPYSSNTYSGGSPHPIMDGVSSLTNSFTEQTNTLTSGAVSLVNWDSGYSMIAQKGNSLGVNLYPGVGYTGDMSTLFVNTARHMLQSTTFNPQEEVLVLHKSNYVSDYMTWLADAGIVATEYNALSSIPSVDELSQYKVVMFIPDVLSHNNSQLGDNFADYIELGGKVIVFTFGFHASWGVTGRYNTTHAPFTIGTDPYSSNTYSGGSPHPIMDGVSSLTNSYTEQTNTLTSGAISLVDWDSGYSMIAEKGNTLGVNLYPGVGYTGDMSILFQNLAMYMLGVVDTTPQVLIGPSSVVYEIGTDASIDLTIIDNNPSRIDVYVNTEFVFNTTWVNGTNIFSVSDIVFDIDTTQLLGLFDVQLIIFDEGNNSITYDFTVNVVDTLSPVFISANAIGYMLGDASEAPGNVTFVAVDPTATEYSIFVDGVFYAEGNYSSNSEVVVELAGFHPGDHIVDLTIFDLAGNKNQVSLSFSVGEVAQTSTSSTSETSTDDTSTSETTTTSTTPVSTSTSTVETSTTTEEPSNSSDEPTIDLDLPVNNLVVTMVSGLISTYAIRRRKLN